MIFAYSLVSGIYEPKHSFLTVAQKLFITASVVYKLLARHGWLKIAPDTRHPAPGTPKTTPKSKRSGKKLPEDLAAILKSEVVQGRKVKILFQDEARFARMVRIRRCWAPRPCDPSSTTATNANSPMFTEPSAQSMGDWTGCSPRK